ncbi:MAG: efflux RND transporter periplasmic adaptor subunit [Glaciecola sp.]
MKSIALKTLVLIAILALSFTVMKGIEATAEKSEEKEPEDNRPVVSVDTLSPINHQVQITSFGEVAPLESTVLAAQVSGEVLNWNENFLPGGVVKRGEVLFTIEADTYEAAVLQNEAAVSLAQATLTEELARQKVAQREARNLPKNQVSDLYLRKPQVLSAQAQLKSAQAGLRIAKRNLAKTQVRAPYDALIISRDIGSGQFVSPGTRVAKINNIETAEVTVPVAGFDSPFLSTSVDKVTAEVSSQGSVVISRLGLVNRNLGIVDDNTRMQHLVIRIEDPYSLGKNKDLPIMKFGTYVQVAFSGREIQNVFKIPQSLVNNRKIWLVNKDEQLESHTVEVIREEGDYFYISSGITAQDRLVQNLPEYPQNGMAVKVINDPSALYSASSMSVASSAN